MCLDKLTEGEVREAEGEGFVWVREKGDRYFPIWNKGRGATEVGMWEDAWEYGDMGPDGPQPKVVEMIKARRVDGHLSLEVLGQYAEGWHIFVNAEQARNWARAIGLYLARHVLLKVRWRWMICRGVQKVHVVTPNEQERWASVESFEAPVVVARYRYVERVACE